MFVSPTNAKYNSNNQMILEDPKINNSSINYMPQITSTPGTNLFVKLDRKIYFSIWGGEDNFIDLQIAPFLYIKFGVPATTPE